MKEHCRKPIVSRHIEDYNNVLTSSKGQAKSSQNERRALPSPVEQQPDDRGTANLVHVNNRLAEKIF
jgi:hypothetical protein